MNFLSISELQIFGQLLVILVLDKYLDDLQFLMIGYIMKIIAKNNFKKSNQLKPHES
jgi:hypothetical protein